MDDDKTSLIDSFSTAYADHDLRRSIKSILVSNNINDENNKLLNSLLEKGIAGLYQFRDDIIPRDFKSVEQLITKLFTNSSSSTTNADHGLQKSIKSILVSNNIFDENDTLLNSLLKKGITGLYQFRDDITPRDFKNIELSIKKLFTSSSSCTNNADHNLRRSIKSNLVLNKFIDENDKLLNSVLEKGISGLYQYRDDITPRDFKNIELSINKLFTSSNSSSANADHDLRRSIKSLLVSNNFIDKNDKLLNSVLKKGITALYQYRDDVTPRDFKNIELSINNLLASSSCETLLKIVKKDEPLVEDLDLSNQQLNIHQIFNNQLGVLNVPNNIYAQIQEKISCVMFNIIKKSNGSLEEQNIAEMFYKPLSSNDSNDFKNIRSFFEKLWRPLIINEKFKIDLLNQVILSCSDVLKNFKKSMSEELFEKFTNLINDSPTNSIQSCSEKECETFSSLDSDKNNFCIEVMKELEKQKEKLILMPDCLEKRFLKLIYLIQLKNLPNNDITHFLKEEEEPTSFDCEIMSINNMFEIEGTNLGNEINESWYKAKSLIKEGNFDSALKRFQVIFKQIQPLDIREMILLLNESQKTYNLIENQDIILLLGMTGSGKTATVYFLSGSKMVKHDVKIGPNVFIDHIAAEEPIQNALSKFVISFQARSETKHINPIKISLDNIGINFITLCDSPGFSDTTGPEVDIVNSINTTEVISRCKSVRPVIVMSKENHGGRSEGIVQMVVMIESMMRNIEDHLSTFTYLFTKYTETNVYPKLYNIANNIDKHRDTMSKYEYKSFKLVLNDMLLKTKDAGKPLDIINDNPQDILRKILNAPCINNPSQVFKYTIVEQSKNALRKQAYCNKSAIQCAVMNNNFGLIIYKIDELIFLCDTLRFDDLNQILKESIEFVCTHIQKFHNDTIEKLNSCLDKNNNVTNEDLDYYFSQIEKFKCFNDFKRVEQFENICGLSNALFQNLQIKCKEELDKFKSLGVLENKHSKAIFNNLKIISEKCNNNNYSHACQLIHDQVKQIQTDFESSLEKNDFHTSAKHLLLFKNIFIKFNGYKSLEMLATTNKTLKDLITLKLQNLSESCDNLFSQKFLTDQDLSCINNSLQNLKNAKADNLLCKHISKEELEIYHYNFLIKIIQFFENLINQIKSLFINKKFKEMEEIYKQIQLVRQIRCVEQSTANLYHSTIEKIKISVQNLIDDTKKLLESINNGIIDYNILFSNLNYLKDAKWINVNDHENYEDVIKVIQSDLETKALNLYESIKKTNLDIASHSNLEKIDKMLQQLDVLKKCQSYVPSLHIKRDQAFEYVEKLVEESLAEIKNLFCLEKQSLKKKKIKLMVFKIECLMMQPKISQLKLSSIEKVEEEIMKTTNSIKSISKNIEKLKIQQEQYNSVLNEVNSKDNKSDKLKKLLLSINFKSIEELYCRYNENERKISNLENNMDQDKQQKGDLEMIKLLFDEITSKGIIFIKINENIAKLKHKNIESLNSKITKLENKINYAELNDLEFIFKSIHYITAENGLSYLDLCLSSKNFNKKVTSNKTEAEVFLTKYKEFITFEMNFSLKQIQSLNAANSSLAHNLAQKIKFKLDECVTIQSSKLLNNLMQCQRIKKDMTDKLSKYHTSLNQPGDENLKTEIFHAFIQFEEYSENVSYYQFYYDYIKNKEIVLNEFEKETLKLIEKYKYNRVATKLFEVDEKVLKPNTINTIKLHLSTSINNVVNTTKHNLKTIGNNLGETEFKKIAKQLLKLSNANVYLYNDHSLQEKFKSNSYIDQKTYSDLVDIFKFIENEIHRKIKKYAEDITLNIINDDFYEAELKIENLMGISKSLENYCNIDEINTIIQTKHINIENRIDSVTEQYENMQMNDFFQNIPKKFIKKLDKFVKHKNNPKYAESLSKIIKTIKDKVSQGLCKIKEVKLGERSVMMEDIKSILNLIPIEIKGPLESEWHRVKNSINEEYEQFENEFNRIKITSDVNLIYKFIEKCKHYDLKSFTSSMQSIVVTQFHECNQKLSKYLEDNDVSKGLFEFRKCLEYLQVFGNSLVELNSIFKIAECTLRNKFDNICLTLSDLSNNRKSDDSVSCFDNLNLFYELKTKYPALNNSFQSVSSLSNLISYVVNGLVRSYKNITDFFIQNQLNCENSLKELNITKINKSMTVLKKWNNLLISAKKYYSKSADTPIICESLSKIETCILYEKRVETLSTILKTYKIEIFKFEPVKGFKMDQERFYREFVKSLSFLHHSNKLSSHIDCSIFEPNSYENEVLPFLNNYFQNVFESTKNFFSEDNSDKTKQEFEMFRLHLENIKLFETHLKSVAMKFNLSRVEQEVTEKLQGSLNYYFEMINKAGSDACKKAKWLIKIKTYANCLPEYTDYINSRLNTFLKEYHRRKKDHKIEFARLAIALEQDPSNVGFDILSEHSIFKGKIISIFNKNTQNHGLDYVLDKLQGDYIDKKSIQQLQGFYDMFSKDYKETVKKYLNQKDNKNGFDELLKSIKLDGDELFKNVFESKDWKEEHKKKVCKLVANIFALWTLQNTEYYNEMNDQDERDSYLMTPHPSQVISIFCILGLDIVEDTYAIDKVFQNNFVQVGTGEGKSLILAVVSCVLSLIGFNVRCACYSSCLSSRDYSTFLKLFSSLNLNSHVKYATFSSICEDIMNQNFNIRTRVSNFVLNIPNFEVFSQKKQTRPDILLIDEVDVFFNKNFYGKLYNPVATFHHPTINNLTSYIWSERNKELTLKQVMLTPEYQACCKYFEGWEFIVTDAVKEMLLDVMNFQHEYIVKNDKLAYLRHDSLTYSTYERYQTLFAYYFEHENGRISTLSLNQNTYINIVCCSFSFAEIPFKFYSIMGVTATLKSLSQAENDIIQSYGVKKFTYIPSIFGANKLRFDKKSDILLENDNDYFVKLSQHIEQSMGTLKEHKRPVLVFFETKSTLMEFYNWSKLSINKEDIQIITEEVSEIPRERDMLIKRATISGQITFLTRVFGRETDFVCSDKNVQKNLGVHVVQTFFSKELSEEVQIQGRTARQGKDGTYSMVLKESDLKYFLGADYSSIAKKQESTIYDILNLKRNELFDSTYLNIATQVNEAKKAHKSGEVFVENLKNLNTKEIKAFLMKENAASS